MTATATRRRAAVGYDATRGKIHVELAGSGNHVHVPDDGESVAGHTNDEVFQPVALTKPAQIESARIICRKLGLALIGSPLTSRAVFHHLNPNH